MADMQALELLLDYRTLEAQYVEYGRNETVLNPFYSYFTSIAGKEYRNDQVEFIKLGRVKDPAPTNLRGQAARMLQPSTKSGAKLSMLSMFNAIRLGMDSLMMLRDPENWVLQEKGRMEITTQVEDFATKHVLTKQVFQSKMLSGQYIYIDINGDICETQPSDPSRGYTIETGIPSGNVGNVGGIIDKLWSNPAAKIMDQLEYLAQHAEDNNREPLRHVWMYRPNKLFLRKNEQIIEWFAGGAANVNASTDARIDNAMKGDTFELGNFMFHFYGGSYTDVAGTNSYYIPTTKAILTPDVGPWVLNGTGLQLIPNSFDISPDTNPADGWDEKFGDFSYVVRSHNPPSLDLYAGSNWLFGLKNPNVVYVPTIA